ncbi:MAG: hypothetical protein ACOY3Y_05215, partial [Acidobacteriota bacterium]
TFRLTSLPLLAGLLLGPGAVPVSAAPPSARVERVERTAGPAHVPAPSARAPRRTLRGGRAAAVGTPVLAVESTQVDFAGAVPGDEVLAPGAIVARVSSPGPYRVVVEHRGWSAGLGGATPPAGRLSWRSRAGSFMPFVPGTPAIVASGGATRPGGDLVVIDLRLAPTDTDPTGSWTASLGIRVEPW